MIGLSTKSDIKEQVVSIDTKTAIKYRVIEEKIDLEALKAEKASLEAQLVAKEPTEKELIEMGKAFHPYYQRDIEAIKKRIEEIDGNLQL